MATAQNPLDTLYQLRSKTIVIALTGTTGSGCTSVADVMELGFEDLKKTIRSQEEVWKYEAKGSMKEERFKREYSICYEYCEKNYNKKCHFRVIRYRNILVYCILKYFVENTTDDIYMSFVKALNELLVFKKGTEDEKQLLEITASDIDGWGLNEILIHKFEDINKCHGNKNELRKLSYGLFFSNEFTTFCENFYDALKANNYYAKNYLVHKLACAFRGHGNPERTFPDGAFENGNVYHIVEVINDIIKGAKYQDEPPLAHFVIDSIRNSIELAYLRERYHSFYSVAVHNLDDELVKTLIREKVKKKMKGIESEELERQVENILELNNTEDSIEDFEKGRFYAPDIARCIAECEMHMCYRASGLDEEKKYTFYSIGEQWLRFVSLVFRPGIVTPTCDERCMAIAYVAKFNSGCISRQVGCAIFDGDNRCKSIGWNDPPAGQLPCSLRSVEELLNTDPSHGNYRCYSCYEQKGMVKKGEGLFRDNLKTHTSKYIPHFSDLGLNYPYCFSSRYNKFYGEKDKVNTRALHAEENAILRIGGTIEGGQMFVTASPCVLCSKKAYQVGIKRIVFLDPYSDIAPMHIIECGDNSPRLESFMGAIGETYYRLYRPYLPFKDELSILEKAFD